MSLPRRAARTRAASSNASASSGSTSWAPRSMAASASAASPCAPTSTMAIANSSGSDLISPTIDEPASRSMRGVEQQHVRAPAPRRLEHLGRALGLDHDAAERLEDGADRAPRTVVRDWPRARARRSARRGA